MTETDSITNTTADTLRRIADALDAGRLPEASPRIDWHGCSDDQLRGLLDEFAELDWKPVVSPTSGGEWISARIGNVDLTGFAANPEPVYKRAPRLSALLVEGGLR